jgi:hypothetical protein
VSDAKTVRIRCATWDQVEAFYTEKLRGNMLVVKMPFRPGIGESVTVALGLPGGMVFAIDGTVVKIGGDDAGKTPVALRLFGLTQEMRTQLRRLVAQARGGPAIVAPGARAAGTRPPRARIPETLPPQPGPRAEDVLEEERAAFAALAAVHRRILTLPVHEVLDVAADADPELARLGYLARCQKLHPDVFRRYRSPALRQLATEVFLHVRRAYEQMVGRPPRDGWLAVVPEGGAPEVAAEAEAPGEPIAAASSSPYADLQVSREGGASQSYEDELTFTTSVRMKALTAEELFDDEAAAKEQAPATAAPPEPPSAAAAAEAAPGPSEAPAAGDLTPLPAPLPQPPDAPPPTVALGREALSDGRWRDACQTFAAILRAEPRNRHVRALYHVASGMELRAKGEGANARLQFETALAHDKECEEAQRALVHEPDKKGGLFKRLFER